MKHFIFHYMEYDNGQAIRDGVEYYTTSEDVDSVNVNNLTGFVQTHIVKDPNAAIAILNIQPIDEDVYYDKVKKRKLSFHYA
jgi:hypothetical protein